MEYVHCECMHHDSISVLYAYSYIPCGLALNLYFQMYTDFESVSLESNMYPDQYLGVRPDGSINPPTEFNSEYCQFTPILQSSVSSSSRGKKFMYSSARAGY